MGADETMAGDWGAGEGFLSKVNSSPLSFLMTMALLLVLVGIWKLEDTGVGVPGAGVACGTPGAEEVG